MELNEGTISLEADMGLYFRVCGDGSQTLVIPNARSLVEEFRIMAEGRRLIFYDQRGRGGSPPITDESLLWTDYEVQDIDVVREYFGLERFSLLGWSYMGAMVALYAQRYRDFVDRLVLICPISMREPAPYDETRRKAQEAAEARIDPNELERFEGMNASSAEEMDPVAYCRQHNRTYMPARMAVISAIERMKSDPCIYPNEWPTNLANHFQRHFPADSLIRDWREELSQLQTPTLIIHGKEDIIPLDSSREWAATLPNARLLVIQECGHFPFLEQPEIFFSAVDSFIGGTWPDGAIAI